MSNLNALLSKLESAPENVDFAEAIAVIDANYTFTPTGFDNGDTRNEAATNNGSCKIFAFAKWHNLSPEQTLALFGNYYRIDVLQNPTGNDHANIRNFIQSGWQGIHFDSNPLQEL